MALRCLIHQVTGKCFYAQITTLEAAIQLNKKRCAYIRTQKRILIEYLERLEKDKIVQQQYFDGFYWKNPELMVSSPLNKVAQDKSQDIFTKSCPYRNTLCEGRVYLLRQCNNALSKQLMKRVIGYNTLLMLSRYASVEVQKSYSMKKAYDVCYNYEIPYLLLIDRQLWQSSLKNTVEAHFFYVLEATSDYRYVTIHFEDILVANVRVSISNIRRRYFRLPNNLSVTLGLRLLTEIQELQKKHYYDKMAFVCSLQNWTQADKIQLIKGCHTLKIKARGGINADGIYETNQWLLME